MLRNTTLRTLARATRPTVHVLEDVMEPVTYRRRPSRSRTRQAAILASQNGWDL